MGSGEWMQGSFVIIFSFSQKKKLKFIILCFASNSISSNFPYAHKLFPTYITMFLCFVLILILRNMKCTRHLGNKGSPPDVFNLSSMYSKPKRMQYL